MHCCGRVIPSIHDARRNNRHDEWPIAGRSPSLSKPDRFSNPAASERQRYSSFASVCVSSMYGSNETDRFRCPILDEDLEMHAAMLEAKLGGDGWRLEPVDAAKTPLRTAAIRSGRLVFLGRLLLCLRGPARCTPQRLRRLTEAPDEGTAHSLGRAEAGRSGDYLDRLARCLHSFPSDLDAQSFDRL